MPSSVSTSRASWTSSKRWAVLIAAVAVVGAVIAAAAFSSAWLPEARQWWNSVAGSAGGEPWEPSAPPDEHAGHDHAGHDETQSIELSPQAWKNVGLEVGPVELREFERTITVPGIVVERPGRTLFQVSAPLTGMVTGVHVTKGQAVQPGDLLFDVRLTHEDLVQTQTEFLKTLEALDVEKRELARLERASEGAIARKSILEREYEIQKLEALLRAQREGLLLHGLSEPQVQEITQERRLLRELSIHVPEIANHEEEQQLLENLIAGQVAPAGFDENTHDMSHPLLVQSLDVRQGDVVEAGSPLATVADLKVLFIEGHGFEQDADEIVRAAGENWPVTALFENRVANPEPVSGLQIIFVANEVESESRAFHFYVGLPNEIVRDVVGPGGRRFVAWRYKPGQRTNLMVPVERWENKIVLPVEAIAEEGPEAFVFVRNGDHFDRRPVHVEHRGQREAVIANDGSIFPGDRVALNAAHQLQMALKNKAGGGVDPHAGHSH